jgi:uncharacterized BrkB/YihY/UPF0761 family membrane protein
MPERESNPIEDGPVADPVAEPRPSMRERVDALRVRADTAKASLKETSDQLRARNATVQLAYEAYEDDRRQAGSLLAGGLAYRLFLWLLPATLFVVTVLGLIVDLSGEAPETVAHDAGLGAALGATVAQAVRSSSRATIPLLLLAAWLTVWAGRSVVKAVRLTASVVWGLEPTLLRASLLASVSFTGVVVGLSFTPALLGAMGDVSFGLRVFGEVVLFLGLAALAWWGQTLLPHQPIASTRSLIPGAILFAVGIDAIRLFTEVYLAGRLGRVDDLYGSIGFATVFMLWLYVVSRIVVATFGLNAARWRAEQRARDTSDPTTSDGSGDRISTAGGNA